MPITLKLTSIAAINAQEAQMVEDAAKAHETEFGMAVDAANALWELAAEGDTLAKTHALFYATAIRNHLLKAIFAAARHHLTDCAWNQRMAVEFAPVAVFAAGNPDIAEFEKATRAANAGKMKGYMTSTVFPAVAASDPQFNQTCWDLKNKLSGAGAHADITYAFAGFDMTAEGFDMPFFDNVEGRHVRGNLLFCADIAAGTTFAMARAFGSGKEVLASIHERMQSIAMRTAEVQKEIPASLRKG